MTPKLEPLLDHLHHLNAPADLPALKRLLSSLEITREDLCDHVHFDGEHYARNKIAQNDWFELVCLCWKPEQRTPIHDHRASSCALRIVDGVATETIYELGEDGRLAPGSRPFLCERGYICASWDKDIHEISNDSTSDLITLHIYSPALTQVHIYSRETGSAELWSPHIMDPSVGAAGI